jgi:hypothetical protein
MKSKVTIRYTSSREDQFEVDLFGGGASEARLKEFIKDPTIVLQTETELIIIPANSIERITLSLPQSGSEHVALPNVRKGKRLK